METSIFVTDLARQFSLSVGGQFTLLLSLSGWPKQAGAGFSDLSCRPPSQFDCEDLVTARVMCPTGNNPENS